MLFRERALSCLLEEKVGNDEINARYIFDNIGKDRISEMKLIQNRSYRIPNSNFASSNK